MKNSVDELLDLRGPDNNSSPDLNQVANALESASPEDSLAWAFDTYDDKLSIATGFGAEGMALIDMAARINPKVDVFFIDTGFLFPETYDLRRQVEERYGIEIRAVRTGLTAETQQEIYGSKLWTKNPDLCCGLRKVEPLKAALRGLDAWITAIRRDQTADRAAARVVEWDSRWQLVKINPLVGWTRREVWKYVVANRVRYNPLHDQGYPSIGCTHCTRSVMQGEADRSGRWAGHHKTECGLHAGSLPVIALASGMAR